MLEHDVPDEWPTEAVSTPKEIAAAMETAKRASNPNTRSLCDWASWRWGKLYGKDGHVETARRIIRSDFAEPTRIGVIRLREHLLFRPEFPVGEYIGVLKEIFQA